MKSERRGPRSADGKLEQIFGMLLVDGDGTLIVSNDVATALLDDGDGLAAVDGRLVALRPLEAVRLRALVADATRGRNGPAGRGGFMRITRVHQGPLAVLVAPARARHPSRTRTAPDALVFTVDPAQAGARPADFLLQLHELSGDAGLVLLHGAQPVDTGRRGRTASRAAAGHRPPRPGRRLAGALLSGGDRVA